MVVTRKISFQTKGHSDIIDITRQVAREVGGAGIKSGIVTLFVSGSTAGISTIEFEPGLVADFKGLWQRIAPAEASYQHDLRLGDGNGYSHVRASLLGASLVVPVVNGSLALGTWQQIVVVDFDNRPRSREVVVQVIGD